MDFPSVYSEGLLFYQRPRDTETRRRSRVMEDLQTQMNPREESWADLQFWSYFLDVGGRVLTTMMGCLLCAEQRVPLQALNFQGADIAFHVSLIQVVIAGRPEQKSHLVW